MNPFSYNLPKELIAQRPVKPYHQAKMLVVERKGRAFKDSVFLDISSYLSQSDIVVFNDTKVVKARLFGVFGDGGKAEVLLLDVVKEIDNTRRVYVALGRPMKKLREGRDLVFRGDLKGRIIKRVDEKKVLLELSSKRGLSEALEEAGVMPIPPYI
ncbi:MAG: tRNA preQ1(34) S-adenosylmethionine ribosyltransferase-isomerase QueA, partial [Candidatus Dadabacteria bacterium]